jgi:hypothetical protein
LQWATGNELSFMWKLHCAPALAEFIWPFAIYFCPGSKSGSVITVLDHISFTSALELMYALPSYAGPNVIILQGSGSSQTNVLCLTALLGLPILIYMRMFCSILHYPIFRRNLFHFNTEF